MHRIDTNGSVSGRFNDGNPAVGQQATQLDAAFCNSVQETLAFIMEQAGIVLVKGDDTQLYDAVLALIAGVVGTGGGAVPTTRAVTGGGLVTGGGALAVDRVLTVTKATTAEVAARARDDVAVTPAGLVGLLATSGAAGVLILTIGTVIIQVFSATASSNATTVVTLPTTFPTECVAAFCNGGEFDYGVQDNGPWVSGRGLSSLSIFNAIGTIPVQIIAIGR